jgi:outer membrane receptor for ferrienterochelin and colicins
LKITFPVVLLAFLYFFFHELYGEISGKVIDQTSGKPIKDVEITIPGTRIGVISDAEGFFKIEHQSKEKKIQLSHIAYENQYMTLNEIDTAIVVKLKESLLHMEDIVVTSMRSGYLLRDVPVSTEVISKKEISSSGAITVDEIMSQRAGVSSSVNVDGGAIFNLLGLDSRYILVLKNGQPITGRFNNRVDLSQISLNRVQKIEITKGPGSALYGTDAMGGIINIITDDDSSEEYNLLKLNQLIMFYQGILFIQ